MPFISSMAAGKGGKIFPLGAKPAVIGLIALTAGDATDTFSWSAPNNNGLAITKYGYQTSTNDGSSWSSEVEVLTTTAVISTQYSLSSFKIRVRSFNAAGWSDYSTISTVSTVAWTNNTGTETETDTVCGPAGCSDTENVTETDTETVTETDTDTVCGPEGCSQTETQGCICGSQSRTRTRTSSRTKTRTRSRDRTRVRSRTRTRTSSRTRTRSTQFYSRSGSTSSGVTYGAYGAYTDYTYSEYGDYGSYSYTEYTGYGSYYYSDYTAYGPYSYTAYPAYGDFSACDSSGTWTDVTATGCFSEYTGNERCYTYVTDGFTGTGYMYMNIDPQGVAFQGVNCGGPENGNYYVYNRQQCSAGGFRIVPFGCVDTVFAS